jgi:hypothetical protein
MSTNLFRITNTETSLTIPTYSFWSGLCVVIRLEENAIFPNGEEYRYKKVGKRLRLLDGPHKGVYELEKIF